MNVYEDDKNLPKSTCILILEIKVLSVQSLR